MIAKYLVEAPTPGVTQPTEDPAGIALLADGFVDAEKIPFAWDYFHRPVPFGKGPQISVGAEMIYWERPAGGRVFHSGSINLGSTLALDDNWSGLMQNVLSHFGVKQA
jgi:N,N-dimethylformamidase